MSLRIIGGAFRGRTLLAPPGQTTRPTNARARQALFDMLMHAPWAGRGLLDGATVLDGFAGTGALGLEALSRGAAHAVFVERDPAACAAIAANIVACKAEDRATLLRRDILHLPDGAAKTLVFLDPPYGQNLLPAGIAVLRQHGWIDSSTIIVAEAGQKDKISPHGHVIARTIQGAAQMAFWRESFA